MKIENKNKSKEKANKRTFTIIINNANMVNYRERFSDRHNKIVHLNLLS